MNYVDQALFAVGFRNCRAYYSYSSYLRFSDTPHITFALPQNKLVTDLHVARQHCKQRRRRERKPSSAERIPEKHNRNHPGRKVSSP